MSTTTYQVTGRGGLKTIQDPSTSSRLRVFRDDIQGIRGLAVLMVIIHHIGFSVYGGVDISFVLSGYLATDGVLRDMSKGDLSLRQYVTQFVPKYYARRIRRVIPLASIVIVATLIASYLLAPAYRLREIGWDGLWTALSGVNYRFAIIGTNYFASDNKVQSPFQHYWSLAVEEQFYLVFPWVFLVLFMLGKRLRAVRTVLAIGIALLFAASLYASIKASVVPPTAQPKLGEEAAQPWAYFPLHTRAWEIMLGCLVAVAARQFARMWLPLAAVMSWSGLVVIAVGSVVISRSSEIPGSVMLWPTIGAALFITGGCANPWYGAELLFGKPEPRAYVARRIARFVRFVPKVLQYLGQVSYGWYLWHWAPLVLVPYAVGRPLNLFEKMAIVVGTLLVAIVTNRIVEQPIKAARDLTTYPRKGIKLGYRCVVSAAVAASFMLVATTAGAQPSQNVSFAEPASISKLVGEAAMVSKLPASAEQQLGSIKSDLYPGCIAGIKETRASSCTLGDPNGNDGVVLLGSSLAWQWIPPLNRIMKEQGIKLTVFSKAGCPGERYQIDTLEGDAQGDTYNECNPWREDAYSQIAALKPQMVILSSRVEPQAKPADITAAVAHFKGQGAQVVSILETPHMGKDVPNCLSLNGADIRKCSVPQKDRPQREMAAKTARAAGATVIDPTPWFCANGVCPTVIDGKIVYWDDHHASATFSQWLTKAIEVQMPTLKNSK